MMLAMPAQRSEGDPVSTALQLALTPNKNRYKTGDMALSSSSSTNIDNSTMVESRIMPTVTEVLSTEIKYSTGNECYNSADLFTQLKGKYTVLNANSQIITTNPTTISSSKISMSTPSTPEKKIQQHSPQSSSSSTPLKVVVTAKNSNVVSLPSPKNVLYPPSLICLGWKGSVPVGAGFINLGNTCYLNSALQALLHVPAFVNWLQSDQIHTSQCESMNGVTHSECLICAMVKILQNTRKFTGSAIKPLNIYSKLKEICKHLVHGHQEDAHEFLRYLIEGMERSYLTTFNGIRLDSYSKETTPLNQIFGGYMRTEVSCLECGYVSTTFQHFQDLLLDIRQANSVEEALESYFSRERLGDGDGDQAYKCSQCKRRAAATKKFSIEKPPNALCIQLKRFNAMGGKNNKHVSVKQTLDMTRYIHPSHPPGCILKYKLVSMVSHLGQSANCGHYTAIGQTAAGSYYHFDDNIVRPVPLQNVLNTNAYIIMYEMVETSKEKTESYQQRMLDSNGVGTSESKKQNILQPQVSDKKVIDVKQTLPSEVKRSQSPLERSGKKPSNENNLSSILKKVTYVPENTSDKNNTKLNLQAPTNNVERSLVPYSSESSESESGCDTSQTTPNSQLPSPSGAIYDKGKNINRDRQSNDSKGKKENSLLKSDDVAIKEENGKTDAGWQVTSSNSVHLEDRSSTNTSSGKWSVVRIKEQASCKKEGNSEEDLGQKGSTNKFIEIGNKSESCKNQSSTSWSPPSGSCQSTVNSLMEMSHQGYGTTNVNSWNGNKSKISKDLEKNRLSMKRPLYCDEPDRGKIKKRRYHKNGNNENDGNGSWNRMQEFQNRKHCWNNQLNGSSRQNFYRQYAYEKSKGHNNHHPHFRGGGGGGNYYRNGNGGNGFSLNMMSPSILYKKPHCT